MKTYYLSARRNWSEQSDYIVVSPSSTAKSMLYYVQEAGHFYTLPYYSTERQNLNSFLVMYTLAGKGHLTYRGEKYTVVRGDLFFIDCQDYQYYETDKSELWEFSWVHFNGGASRFYFEQFFRLNGPVLTMEDEACPAASMINELIDIHRSKDALAELLSSKLLVELLTELLVKSMNLTYPHEAYLLPSCIQAMKNTLDQRFTEAWTLDQLSAEFSISKYHLAREFKKYTGHTPNQYLISTRLNAAKDLLKHTDQPISAVAREVGFENVSHFINLFKKQEDLTPLAYKNKWKLSI